MQGHAWEERCCFHPNAMKGENSKGRAQRISGDPTDIRSEYQRDARITLDFLSGFTHNYAVRAFEEVFLPRPVL